MKRWLSIGWLAIVAVLPFSGAQAQQRAQYEEMVATHARANLVPEALVHRVIVRESKYQPDLVGRGGTIGLMQIKLGTARSLGYTGDAKGLRDPETNLTYAVRYLAGAYRAANGDHDRAVHYYASGYYQAAKQQRLERERWKQAAPMLAGAPPKAEFAKPEQAARAEEAAAAVENAKENARPEEGEASKETMATPKQRGPSKTAAAKSKREMRKKLAEVREPVPRPPASLPAGANPAKPR